MRDQKELRTLIPDSVFDSLPNGLFEASVVMEFLGCKGKSEKNFINHYCIKKPIRLASLKQGNKRLFTREMVKDYCRKMTRVSQLV